MLTYPFFSASSPVKVEKVPLLEPGFVCRFEIFKINKLVGRKCKYFQAVPTRISQQRGTLDPSTDGAPLELIVNKRVV